MTNKSDLLAAVYARVSSDQQADAGTIAIQLAALKKKVKSDVMRAIDMFGCKVIFMKPDYCILEIVGDKDETETISNYFKPLGIEEIARTGIIALQQKNNNET